MIATSPRGEVACDQHAAPYPGLAIRRILVTDE
jgi:hypothetical protein